MKTDLSRLIKGELLIEISGARAENLLNLAIQQGVEITDIQRTGEQRISCRIRLTDIYRLRYLTRGTRCRISIRRRRGVPFLLFFMRRRPLLVFMAALGIFVLSYISSLVFSLTVSSPYELSDQDSARVLQLSGEAGVREWRSRWRMDLETAEQYILNGFPELFYVEIYQHGVSLEVRVVKRVDIPEEELHAPGNLVASAPGIIRDILVRRGTAAVESGATVKQGDVLIYGWWNGELTSADGIVNAMVYGEGYGECAERQTLYRETGNSVSAVSLRTADSILTLLGQSRIPYDNYRLAEEEQPLMLWRKIPLPVEVIFTKAYETLPYQVKYTTVQAAARAKAAAVQMARDDLPLGDQARRLSSETITVEIIALGDGIQRARAIAEALADIGVFHQFTEQEATEAELHMQ